MRQRAWDGMPYFGPSERIRPYYQPIAALDSRRIMGYEALGRIESDEGAVRSLGPFFGDKTVPMKEQIRVDRFLREQALRAFAAEGAAPERTKLFLNLKPSWIFGTHARTGDLPTLRLMDKHGVDPSRVVIEITEEAFSESMEQLRAVVDVYRREGCMIAIDDVGSGFSNMDRIAQLQPHLLKIDIHMLQRSERHSGYYGVLRSFSTLADQIGSSLLVEGVETEAELQRAIAIGARYVQGYLFAQAERSFRPPDSFCERIESGLQQRRFRMLQAERYWSAQAETLRAAVDGVRRRETDQGGRTGGPAERAEHAEAAMDMTGRTGGDAESAGRRAGATGLTDATGAEHAERARDAAGTEHAEDAFIERLLPELADGCIRVYLCREDGVQLSSNYRRGGPGAWCREAEYRGLNWSWRPYFIPVSVDLESSSRAIASQTYTDLDSTGRIRTVIVPVPERGILFIDMTDDTNEDYG